MHEKINYIIGYILNAPNDSPLYPLAQTIQEDLNQDKIEAWMQRKKEILSALTVFLNDAKATQAKFFYVNSLSSFASLMARENEEEEGEKWRSQQYLFFKIGKPFFDRVLKLPVEQNTKEEDEIEDEQGTKILKYFEGGSYYRCLRELKSYSTHPQLRKFHEHFSHFSNSIKDEVKLREITNDAKELSFSQLAVLWGYPKYIHLLKKNIENVGIQLDTIHLLFPHLGSDGGLPFFVPQEIGVYLIPHLSTISNDGEDMLSVLLSKTKIIYSPEEFLMNCKEFVANGKIGEDFQINLHHTIVSEESELKEILKKANSLYYWDEREDIFTNTWTLQTIVNVLKNFEISNAKDSELLENFKTLSSSPKQEKTPFSNVPLLEVVEVVDAWKPFAQSGQITLPTFANTQIILYNYNQSRPPKLGRNQIEQTANTLFSFFLRPIRWDFSEMLKSETLLSMINYPQTPLPNQLIKTNSIQDGSVIQKNDVLTLFLQTKDPILLHFILQDLANSSSSLPLLINPIISNKTKKTFFWNAYENVDFFEKQQGSPGRLFPFRFPQVPHRFVLVLRVGDVSGSGNLTQKGRTTLLNELCLNKPLFGSSSTWGKSISGKGILEFIHLNETTAAPILYNQLDGAQVKEPTFLALLHGNALDESVLDSAGLQGLSPLLSALLVFYSAKDWEELKRQRESLNLASIGKEVEFVNIFNIVLYPDETISQRVNPANLIHAGEPDPIKAAKLSQILVEAIKYHAQIEQDATQSIPMELPPNWEYCQELGSKESAAFLQLIANHKIQDVKIALTPLYEGNPPHDLSPLGKEVILRFLDVLHLSPEEMMISSLHKVHLELERKSQSNCEEISQRIFQLRQNYSIEYETEMKLLLERKELGSISLQFLIFCAGIWIARYESSDVGGSGRLNYVRAMETIIASGFPIQLDKSLESEEYFPFLEQALGELGNKSVVALGICGGKGSGKSSLLNKLYGAKFFGEWSSTKGLQLRVLRIASRFGAELLLLVDCEGMAAAENVVDGGSHQRERRLLSTLLLQADLTCLHFNDEDDDREVSRFLKILEGSLLSTLTEDLEKNLLSSLLVTKGSFDQSDFKNSLLSFSNFVSQDMDGGLFDKSKEPRLGKIFAQAFSRKGIVAQDEDDEEPLKVSRLKEVIQENLLQARALHSWRSNFKDWVASSRALWNSRPITTIHAPNRIRLQDIELAKNKTQLDSNVQYIKHEIGQAFTSHVTQLLPNFVRELNLLFAEDVLKVQEFAEDDALDDEIKLLLSQVRNNLQLVIYDDCALCSVVFRAIQVLNDEMKSLDNFFQTKELIQDYIKLQNYEAYAMFQQIVIRKRLENRKWKGLKSLVKSWIDSGKSYDETWRLLLQHVSWLEHTPNWSDRFLEEISRFGLKAEEAVYNGEINENRSILIKYLLTHFFSESSIRVVNERDYSLAGRSSGRYLSTWLRNNLNSLPLLIFKEMAPTGFFIYRDGMGKLLLDKINLILEILMSQQLNFDGDEKCTPDCRKEVTLLGVGIFNKWIMNKEETHKMTWGGVQFLLNDKEAFFDDPASYFQ